MASTLVISVMTRSSICKIGVIKASATLGDVINSAIWVGLGYATNVGYMTMPN